MSVNVSWRQLLHPMLLAEVEALIAAAQTEGLDALTAKVAQGGAQAAIVTTQGSPHSS